MKEIWTEIWEKLKPVLISIGTLCINHLVAYIRDKLANKRLAKKQSKK